MAPDRSGDAAKQVLFQTPGGTRRAWQVVTMGAAKPSLHVLDAATGRILYRVSLSSDATAPRRPRPSQAEPTALSLRQLPGRAQGRHGRDGRR